MLVSKDQEQMNNLEIKTYSSLRDLESFKSNWNELVSQNDTNEIFLTYEWFQSWCAASDEKETPLILTMSDMGSLVGIAPLAIKELRKKRVKYRSLRFMSPGDYADFIVLKDYRNIFLERIFDYLLRGKNGWDSIELLNIPEYSRTVKIMTEVCKDMRKKFEISRDMVCPSLRINGDLEFAESCLKKKSIVRHYNYFKRNGELIYTRLSTGGEIESHLEPFFEQHIKRRELAEETSLFLIPNRKAFYRYLVKFMPRDWIHFTALTFKGIPIAYHFGFSYGNKLTWYKPSFDVSYATHSPGETLLFFLIKESIENGARELDFTIGDEAFKRRFSNLIRYNYRIEYVRNRKLDFYWRSISNLKKIRNLIKNI